MLHILIITRPQFMLSYILQEQINISYLSTPIPSQQYKPSTISHVITIRRHIQKRCCLLCHNSTNSHPYVIPAAVENSVFQSKNSFLLNCSNSVVSLVLSSAVLAVHFHGNSSIKTKNSSVPVKPKLWPPTSAQQNSNP